MNKWYTFYAKCSIYFNKNIPFLEVVCPVPMT